VFRLILLLIEQLLYFSIQIGIFVILMNFELNVSLTSQVFADGSVEIIGLGKYGKECFRYYLGSQCSSGVTSNKLSKHGSGPKEK